MVFTDVHGFVCFIDHSVVRVSEDHLFEGVPFLPSLHRPVVDVVADETFYRISEIYTGLLMVCRAICAVE